MKNFLIAIALIATVGCTASPRPQPQLADISSCRAVEGSYAKVDKRGKPVYRYNCNGEIVWSRAQ